MSYDVALHLDFDDQAGMDDYNRVVLGTDYEPRTLRYLVDVVGIAQQHPRSCGCSSPCSD